jgi:hypothetical protein
MTAAYATLLRHELRERNAQFVKKHRVAAQFSYGSAPVVVYEPEEGGHGNFIAASYHAICGNQDWRKRLSKVHTSARVSFPKADRKWCELDSCNSSDALLMNVFCYPGIAGDPRFLNALGVEHSESPIFGFKARVPLADGKFDRTEVDLKLGDLLIESKLTESDFQSKTKEVVDRYRDFQAVFQRRDLPKTATTYLSYQLIRNVLAAHALDCSFCVVCDARRPDLIEQWYAVMRCVKIYDLRTRCKVLTWQELSELLDADLAGFLDEKYGIRPGPITPYQFEHQRE